MSTSLRRKLSMTMSKSDRKSSAFKVVILGQAAVGKTALTVRFMTRRFIWDYDPNLESKQSFASSVDGDPVLFEIIDTAGQEEGSVRLEENIKWADAFILVYSVTDVGSLFSCDRYKFLVNTYARRKKKSAPTNVSSGSSTQFPSELPVALVGNKNDLSHERTVSRELGEQASTKLACTHFHDISVKESYDEAQKIFEELYRYHKNPKPSVKRTSSSDVSLRSLLSLDQDMSLSAVAKENSKDPPQTPTVLGSSVMTFFEDILPGSAIFQRKSKLIGLLEVEAEPEISLLRRCNTTPHHVRERSTFIDGAIIPRDTLAADKIKADSRADASLAAGSSREIPTFSIPSDPGRKAVVDSHNPLLTRRKYNVSEAIKQTAVICLGQPVAQYKDSKQTANGT